MANVIGLDIGGTHIRTAVKVARQIHRFETVAVPNSYPELLTAIYWLYKQAQERCGEVSGMGIGLPGVVTALGGRWIPNLPFLNGQPLTADLEHQVGLRPQLANDAQMALLGELWAGAARKCESAALLSLGTGIGGAFAVGARVVRGASGSAGSFGWLGADVGSLGDSEHGPLERLASGRALQRQAAALQPPLSSFELVDAARQHHPQAVSILAEQGRALGRAVASLVSTLDPQVLLISGGLSDAFDLFEPHIRAQLVSFASPSGRVVPIKRAALGAFAGTYGAIRAASHPDAPCFL